MTDKEIEVELKNPYFFLLLGILLVVLYFEINVTINGPIAFGDEGYWTYISKWIAQNVEYPIYHPLSGSLLKKEGFQNPPLFPFFEGSFYYIFGFSEMIVKILVPVLSFFSALAVYEIFKRLYSDKVGFYAALILATIPAIATYSVLFYVDIFLVYWIIFSVGFFLLSIKEEKRKYFIFSAIFASLAVLTKKTGLILIPFFVIYFFYELWKERKIAPLLKKYLMPLLIVGIILGSFFIRNYAYFGTPLCGLPYVFTSDKCNVDIQYKNLADFTQQNQNTGSDASVYSFGFVNYFQFAYGFIFYVPLLFIIGLALFLIRKEKIDIAVILFLLVSSALFLQTYQGRAEDASRYTLFAVPIIALVCAVYIESISNVLKQHYKYFALALMVLILIISFYDFYTKIVTMPAVKQFSPAFLDACSWAKQNLPSNAIILSLYTAPTSYNCDRKAIWELQDLPDIILSNNLNLTVRRLNANGIGWIFVQKFAMSQQAYRQNYPTSFIVFLESNPQTFSKVFENGPSYGTCVQSGGCDGTAIYKVKG